MRLTQIYAPNKQHLLAVSQIYFVDLLMKFNSAPPLDEYHQFYGKYISLVDPEKIPVEFTDQPVELRKLLNPLSDAEVNCLHEPYTWTLKQVVGHLIDCERIFSHRLNRIAVGDPTPIPGIDQNKYVAAIDYSTIPMPHLLEEFEHLRIANSLLCDRLPTASMTNMGIASDNPVSARANLFILAGHVRYHLEIIKKRINA